MGLWVFTFVVLGLSALGLTWLCHCHKKTLTLKDFCEPCPGDTPPRSVARNKVYHPPETNNLPKTKNKGEPNV